MASFNKVILMGNLTRDPELRYTPNGAAVCEITVAMNRKYTVNGQERDEVCFVDVVVWNKQAESCGKYLLKGRPVLIEGRLQLDTWQNKDGQNRSRLRVAADRVQFLSAGTSSNTAPRSGGGYENSGYQPNNGNNFQKNGYQGTNYSNNDSQNNAPKQNGGYGNASYEPMPEPPEDIYSNEYESEDDIPFQFLTPV